MVFEHECRPKAVELFWRADEVGVVRDFLLVKKSKTQTAYGIESIKSNFIATRFRQNPEARK